LEDTTGLKVDSNMAAEIVETRMAGMNHAVTTVKGGHKSYRKEPCSDCPWKVSSDGIFPAEAFIHSANTAKDMSMNKFACHQSGVSKPATCAGFLLCGSDHNLGARLAQIKGEVADDVIDGGHALHQSYVDMAVANGVDPAHKALKGCR
jgi:hypothetical protein